MVVEEVMALEAMEVAATATEEAMEAMVETAVMVAAAMDLVEAMVEAMVMVAAMVAMEMDLEAATVDMDQNQLIHWKSWEH